MILLYVAIAAACVAVPYSTLSAAFAALFLPYTTGPLAFASITLGVAAHARPRWAYGELLVAGLWGIAAIALSFQLVSSTGELEFHFAAMRVQAWLSALGGCGMVLAGILVYRERRAFAVIQALGYLGLTVYLWRRGLLGLGLLEGEGGFAGLVRELRYSQYALVGSGTLILTSTVWSLRERWRRPTSG